jgi:hypothetical protein
VAAPRSVQKALGRPLRAATRRSCRQERRGPAVVARHRVSRKGEAMEGLGSSHVRSDPITHDIAQALTKHTPVDDGEGFLCSCSTASTLVDYTPRHLGGVWREARTIRTCEQLDALLHADARPPRTSRASRWGPGSPSIRSDHRVQRAQSLDRDGFRGPVLPQWAHRRARAIH